MREVVVIGLTDEHCVRRRLGQKLAPLEQALMRIQRIVAIALDCENRAGEFVL